MSECISIVDGERCAKPTYRRDWCRAHYRQLRIAGTIRRGPLAICTVIENGIACTGVVWTRDWCQMHYRRWRRTGSTDGAKVCRKCAIRFAHNDGFCVACMEGREE